LLLTKSRSSLIVLPLLTLAALAALASPACSSTSNDAPSGTSTAADTSGAEDVSETESNVESLGVSFVGADGKSVAMASLGASVSQDPGFFLMPAGCVTVIANTLTQTATYTFAGCTGPLGLVHLDGSITVGWTLSLAPASLTLTYAAQGFQINGATISDWTATAVVTEPVSAALDSGLTADAALTDSDGGISARAVVWDATLSGTTASGRAFTRKNHKELTWTVGVPCLSVNGQSTGTITASDAAAAASITTNVTTYTRCESACPQAGSEISVTNVDNGDSIDIVYDGGAKALLTVNGKSSTILLLCGG
jgi:hypothetical protein